MKINWFAHENHEEITYTLHSPWCQLYFDYLELAFESICSIMNKIEEDRLVPRQKWKLLSLLIMVFMCAIIVRIIDTMGLVLFAWSYYSLKGLVLLIPTYIMRYIKT